MDTGMIGLLETCSGSEDIRKTILKESEGIMQIVRDLGGSPKAHRKDIAKSMTGSVAEIYRPHSVTSAI